MVDTISSAKGIGKAGSSRHAASSASSPFSDRLAVAPVAAVTGMERREGDGTGQDQDNAHEHAQDDQDLRLEVAEDEAGKEHLYRFVDAQSGEVVREWAADEFDKLREYVRDKKIHLLDKKV